MLLGYISRSHPQSVGVAGTHGKTTTSGMITTMLELAGKDPAAVIGGKLPLIDGYGKAGNGQSVVIEACEYHETFLHLTSAVGVILNIDNDHLEYYGTMGQLKLAFQKFALLSRTVVFNMDDRNTMDVVSSIDRPVVSFGIHEEARIRAINIKEYKPGFFEFDVLELGEPFARLMNAGSIRFWLQVGIPVMMPGILGTFNMLFANAVAAYATPYLLINNSIALLPIKIVDMFVGDTRQRPELGSALSLVLLGIVVLEICLSNLVKRHFEKGNR